MLQNESADHRSAVSVPQQAYLRDLLSVSAKYVAATRSINGITVKGLGLPIESIPPAGKQPVEDEHWPASRAGEDIGHFEIVHSSTCNGPTYVRADGVQLVFHSAGFQSVPLSLEEGHAVCRSIVSQIDSIRIDSHAFSEELLLINGSIPRQMEYEVLATSGIETIYEHEGGIRFADREGRGLEIKAPVVWDSSGVIHPGAARWILSSDAHKKRKFRLQWNPEGISLPMVIDPSWTSIGNLGNPRVYQTSILLQNGKVLVAGGINGTGSLSSSELYDPATGLWIAANPMVGDRRNHTATLLRSGKVLVAGGHSSASGYLATSELYDPSAGTWTPTGALIHARRNHTATLLSNGKVLVTGGYNSAEGYLLSAELYDPAIGNWTATGAMNIARSLHTATLLSDGRILVAGGVNSGGVLGSAEVYNPVAGTWSTIAGMNAARDLHSATLLGDGRVLVAAGENGSGYLNSSEIWNGSTWSATGNLASPRYRHSANLLPNGKVVIAGGFDGVAYLSAAETYDPSTGNWSPAATMAAARMGQTATLLPDARVLIAGGFTGSGYLASSELFDFTSSPSTAAWSTTGSLSAARSGYNAVLLPSGKVLVAAGWAGGTTYPAVTELYDATTGNWTSTGNLNQRRERATATLLTNGKVLLAGGFFSPTYLNSTELYDPATGVWTSTGSMSSPRQNATATLLPSGKVLECGGNNGTTYYSTCELYDPGTGAWGGTGGMGSQRVNHAAILLPNGKVLIAGGFNGSSAVNSADLYDPGPGTFAATGSMNTPRQLFDLVLLPNGKVLASGGDVSTEIYDPATGTWSNTGSTSNLHQHAILLPQGKVLGFNDQFNSSIEEAYDPATGVWSSIASMSAIRLSITPVLLPNGKVLVAGGQGPSSFPTSAEIFNPGLGETLAIRPVLTSVTPNLVSGSALLATGTNFQGVSESSGGNAGQNSASNYPLLELRSLSNGQSRWLALDASAGWSATSFTSQSVSSFPFGYATLRPFVNGVPGDASIIKISAKPFTSTTTLITSVNPACASQSILFTATVAPGAATGSVQFFDGSTLLGTSPLSGGTATFSTSALSLGSHSIVATYNGDANYEESSSTPPILEVINTSPPVATNNGPLCAGSDLQFFASTLPGASYNWSGPNGFASTQQNPTLSSATLAAAGVYSVTATINGCVSTAANTTVQIFSCVSSTTNMNTARGYHTATLLHSNKVIVAGGRNGSLAALNSSEIFDPATGSWTTTGNLQAARRMHTAVLLPNGKVLMAGGSDGTNSINSAELYDPATAQWTFTGSLHDARAEHTATLLSNGKVLVAGGVSSSVAVMTAELYDPSTGQWTYTGSLNAARYDHTATLLSNGKILVAGGRGPLALATAEIYDPGTTQWTSAGALNTARYSHSATLLTDGRVLVAGGFDSASASLSSAEIYNGAWTSAGTFAEPRGSHTATLLPNGKVRLAGGLNTVANYINCSTDTFDPAGFTWTYTGCLITGRRHHTATLLPGGDVLYAGSYNAASTLNSAELYIPQTGQAVVANSMTTPRNQAGAILLPTGKVLVAGGNSTSSGGFLSSAELFDPGNGTWTATGSMSSQRRKPVLTMMQDGRVIAMGGVGNTFPMVSGLQTQVEVYDSSNGIWSLTGSMKTPRGDFVASLLPGGNILVSGGVGPPNTGNADNLAGAELYFPTTGLWSATGSMGTARRLHTSTLLSNGKVLITGGFGTTGSALSSCELYDPDTGIWSATGPLSQARAQHKAMLLPGGRVLVTGGYDGTNYIGAAEIYDPVTGIWSSSGTALARISPAELLPGGIVMVAGGFDASTVSRSVAFFYPELGIWTFPKFMTTFRSEATVTLLPNGSVLIAGGFGCCNPLASAESYDPGLNFQESWRPTIATATNPLVSGAQLNLTGSQFTGVSEASGSNGNQQSATNYPLVQLRSLGSRQIQFLPSNSWTSTAFTSTPVNSFPNGYSMVTVFANGINSKSEMIQVLQSNTSTTGLISNLNPACQGQSVTLTATVNPSNAASAVQFAESGSIGTGYLSGGMAAFSTSTLSAGVHAITANYGGDAAHSGSSSSALSQTIISTAAPVASNNGPICAGSTLSLAAPAVSGGTYSWSGPNGFSSTQQNPVILNATIAATGTYSVTITANGCTTSAGTTMASVIACGAAGNWVNTTTSLNTGRSVATLTLLQNGKMLIAGGYDSSGTTELAAAEIFDPATGVWTNTNSMSIARARHTAIVLPNGKVLIAGGYSGGVMTNTAEFFDPSTSQWSAANPMNSARALHTATLLNSGKVFVVGGGDGSTFIGSTELFDPSTGNWSSSGSLTTARSGHAATLLANGKALIAGGLGAGASYPLNAELYDPSGGGSWGAAGTITAGRNTPEAILLPSGKVLIAGGTNGGSLGGAQLYDPASNSWGPATAMNTARNLFTLTLLPSGKAVAIGGDAAGPLSSVEFYDTNANTWTTTTPMSVARSDHSAVLLPDGRVFAAGGAGGIASTAIFDPLIGIWANSTNINQKRFNAAAVPLPNGKILLACGGLYTSDFGTITSAELYDLATGTWSYTGSTSTPRINGEELILLNDGRVLLAGGSDPRGVPYGDPYSTEIYNPATGTWSPGASMSQTHYNSGEKSFHLLPNGKVLAITGNGNPKTSNELYDPVANTWSSTGAPQMPRDAQTAVLLANGKVLMAGGGNGTIWLDTAELYDPSTGQWTYTGSMSVPRGLAAISLQPNGKVLVAGGQNFSGLLSTAEIYDPAPGAWSPTGSMSTARTGDVATLLPGGRVVLVNRNNPHNYPVELYDPITGTWSVIATTNASRGTPTSVMLPGGKLLIIGGQVTLDVLATTEMFDLPGGANETWRPAITNPPTDQNLNASMNLAGTNFTGISEASGSGNGNRGSATNYPLVQLTRIDNQQRILLPPSAASNWSATSFTSTPVTGIAPGYAILRMITNGIPSAGSIVRIVANPLPSSTQLSPSVPSVCQNGQITLTATVNPSTATGAVQFFNEGIMMGAAALTGGTASFLTAPLSVGTHHFTATYTGDLNNQPSTSSILNFTVYSTSEQLLVENNGPICPGQTLALSAPSVPGGSYQWSGPAGFSSTQQNPNIAGATSANAGTYSVVVTVGSCALPAATTTAVVACTGGSSDSYEPDDTVYTSKVIQGGETQSHNFFEASADRLKFNACPGRTYTIQTANLGSLADTVLDLYGTDGTTLLVTDDNGGGGLSSKITWTAPASGTYHIRARQFDGRGGPNLGYDISLTGNTGLCAGWARTYGGGVNEQAEDAFETADGNIVMAGQTLSFSQGNEDGWVAKLNPAGAILWQRSYGGAGTDVFFRVRQTATGGFLVSGYTTSFGAGSYDIWILNLDSNGNIVWQKTFGGTGPDGTYEAIQTSDGGYFIAAWTYSLSAGDADFLLIRLDSGGNVLWKKNIGGTAEDIPYSAQQTSDGGFVIAGSTRSTGSGGADVWVIRTDSSGNLLWQTTYGTTSDEIAQSIIQTSDGGYAFAGYRNFGGSVYRFWVVKLDSSGNLVWQKGYGTGSTTDIGYSIQQTLDGGFAVAGFISGGDAWLLHLDSTGNIQWQTKYAGGGIELIHSVKQTADGGYVLGATTGSYGAGGDDAWILRLDANGNVPGSCALQSSTSVTPVTTTATSASSAFSLVDWGGSTAASTAGAPSSGAVSNSQCSLSQPLEVSPPAATQKLLFSSDKTTLTWEAGAINGAATFKLYRGAITDLPSSNYGSCAQNGLLSNTAIESSTPPTGACWFYLVTGKNALGEGPMGFSSDGTPRPNQNPCP